MTATPSGQTEILVDTITEKTSSNGVAIEGVRLKDNGIENNSTNDLPITLNAGIRWRLLGSSYHLRPEVDNTYDIGATSYLLRKVYSRNFLCNGAAGVLGTDSAHGFGFQINSNEVWNLDASGNLNQNATNGGNLVLTKASSAVAQPYAATVSAAGTTISDATDLTAVHNAITSCSSGQGVQLWDAPLGAVISVFNNQGSDVLRVYPHSGSGTIDAASAGAAIQLGIYQKAFFIRLSSTAWSMHISPAASVATGLTAAGSTISDALQLVAISNNVTTTAGSTGVKLFDAPLGTMIYIRNGGANALAVYPDSGSNQFNAGSAGASVSIAAGAHAIAIRVSSTIWLASEPVAA